MTESTSNPNTEKRPALPKNLAIWLVAAGAGMLLLILLVVAVSRPPPVQVSAPLPSGVASELVVDSSQLEKRALAKAELQRLQLEGQEIRRLLQECDQELAAWDKEVESELSGKRGQAVAADNESLERFSAVYRLRRPSKTDLDACGDRVTTLLEPITAALASGALYVPSGDANSKVAAERQIAQAARNSLRDARQNVLSVFEIAQKKGASGTQFLKDAMARLEASETQSRVEAITIRQNEARSQATKLIAEARAEQEMQYGRNEVAQIEGETRREIDKRRAQEAAKDADTRQLVLGERAKDPRVKDKYKPFLEKGLFRPPHHRTERAVPMSYTDLKPLGVFDDLRTFVRAGAGCWHPPGMREVCAPYGNDRPKWTMPERDEDFDQYQERFDEFCLLAPIWAMNGTLNP